MRSLRTLLSIASATIVSLAALACNPSNSAAPSPETAPVAAPAPADNPSEPAAEPGVMEPSADPTDTPPPAEGDVALPPPNASAWNTGQSDGQPGKADRGIKDYQRIVQDNRDRFRACYDAALAKHEGIQGRVTLVWTLDPKGAVMDGAHVDPGASDFQDEFLEKCMVAALKALTFPPSTRGKESTVTYPFNFNPRSRSRK